MTHITTEVDENPLIRLANNGGVRQISLVGGEVLNRRENYIVFLNGELLQKILPFWSEHGN